MQRRPHRLAIGVGLAVAAGACADPRSAAPAPVPTEAPAAPAPAAAPSRPAEAADAQQGDLPAAPAPSEPEDEPAEEAEAVVFPDGTSAVPCEAPPSGMACIPGGPFVRGTDDGPPNTHPAATIWVRTFYMDLHEVTYDEYEACEKAKECPRSGPRYTDFDHPKMPIQGVSWYDAVAYCKAHGKQLPSEAQWEKAARGPDGHLYPWGDEPPTCERAIIKDERGRSCGLPKAISKPEVGRPWDVGSRPAGVYGLYDMVGNSWEWVADWYTRSYEECGEACTGIDPRGPCDAQEPCPGRWLKIVRGGSWYWDETRATGAFRRAHVPNNRPFHHFGFRCAATVDQAKALTAGGGQGKGP